MCKELCNYQYMHRSIKRGKGDLLVSGKCQVHAWSGVDVNILFCEPKYFYFIWQCLCFMFWIFVNIACVQTILYHCHMMMLSYHCHQTLNLTITQISRDRDFGESGIFTWIYERARSFSHMMTTLLIMELLFCVCFLILPNFLKVFAWYMSVSFLFLIFFLVTFRGLQFFDVWILGYDFWFLPNLFDEQLGFVDSFKPL